MDDLDRASAYEQAARDAALRAVLDRPSAAGCRYCIDCEEEIPMKRRAANPSAVRCIDCQRAFERGRR